MSGVVHTMNTPLKEVQDLLALQASAGRPPAAVCQVIAALKDLCPGPGEAPALDWRRGAGGPSGGGGGRGGFRNGATGGGGGGPAGAGSPSNASTTGGLPPVRHSRGYGGSSGSGGGSGSHSHSNPNGPPGRYQSRFKNSQQPVEDKILNNIILSKLNKFSGTTYTDIREFLYQVLGSGEPDLAEMIRHFMMLVFKKAASEEVYCPLYAKLLAEISGRYSVILEEMEKLQANYLEIFDDIEEVPEGGDEYDAFVAKKKEKMYRQGYSQFLAELAGLEILEMGNLRRTFEKLFALLLKHGAEQEKKALNEEYADCLVRMSRVLKKRGGGSGGGSGFLATARAILWECSKEPLERLISQKGEFPSISPKARFILMDVRDNLSA
jgi:hypothetical protein